MFRPLCAFIIFSHAVCVFITFPHPPPWLGRQTLLHAAARGGQVDVTEFVLDLAIVDPAARDSEVPAPALVGWKAG